jgi:hypothetical protein
MVLKGGNRMDEHTFILKLTTNSPDWREHLSNTLNQLCNQIDGSAIIYELNKAGTQKAETILR